LVLLLLLILPNGLTSLFVERLAARLANGSIFILFLAISAIFAFGLSVSS